MDNTDVQIINILQKNCKTPVREIGLEVGLTAPAVSERINRLKDAGVIEGFHAQINEALMGNNLCAFVQINVPPNKYDSFCRFCEGESCVAEHYHIVGPNNALIKLRVKNAKQLAEILERMRDYGLSNTSVLLSTYFQRKDF